MTDPRHSVDFSCSTLIFGDRDTYERAQRQAEELYAQLTTNPSAIEQYGLDALDQVNKLTQELLSNHELTRTDAPTEPRAQHEWLISKRDAYNAFLNASDETMALMVYTVAVMELVHELIIQGLFDGSIVDQQDIVAERSQFADELSTRITEYKARLAIAFSSKPQVKVLRDRCVVLIGQAEILLAQIASRELRESPGE